MWGDSEALKSVGQEKKSLGNGRDKKCREWRRLGADRKSGGHEGTSEAKYRHRDVQTGKVLAKQRVAGSCYGIVQR